MKCHFRLIISSLTTKFSCPFTSHFCWRQTVLLFPKKITEWEQVWVGRLSVLVLLAVPFSPVQVPVTVVFDSTSALWLRTGRLESKLSLHVWFVLCLAAHRSVTFWRISQNGTTAVLQQNSCYQMCSIYIWWPFLPRGSQREFGTAELYLQC